MARFTCAHIKKDNTICGNRCCDPTGCYRHWKLYEKNQKKKPCLFSGCGYHTDNDSGYCSSHSAKIYSHNYRMRQKYGAEALQPAKTSELSDEALQPAVAYELSIEGHRPAETYVSSDEEDLSDGLGLFD
jgi:hypothetical protein